MRGMRRYRRSRYAEGQVPLGSLSPQAGVQTPADEDRTRSRRTRFASASARRELQDRARRRRPAEDSFARYLRSHGCGGSPTARISIAGGRESTTAIIGAIAGAWKKRIGGCRASESGELLTSRREANDKTQYGRHSHLGQSLGVHVFILADECFGQDIGGQRVHLVMAALTAAAWHRRRV